MPGRGLVESSLHPQRSARTAVGPTTNMADPLFIITTIILALVDTLGIVSAIISLLISEMTVHSPWHPELR